MQTMLRALAPTFLCLVSRRMPVSLVVQIEVQKIILGGVRAKKPQLTHLNLLNHPIRLVKIKDLANIDCLRVSVAFEKPSIAEKPYEATFADAIVAHLAPLHFSTGAKCRNKFVLTVENFSRTNALFASRIRFSLQGFILNDEGEDLWHAQYNFSSVDGGLPLDPISTSFGLMAAKKNSSDEGMNVHIYTAVRRLISALPENTKSDHLSVANANELKETGSRALGKALDLWKNNKVAEAKSILRVEFEQTKDPSFGYYLGLMHEAELMFGQAADLYADTALEAANRFEYEQALRALKRLEKLNAARNGQYQNLISATSHSLSTLLERSN